MYPCILPFRPVRSSVCSAMGFTLPKKLCRERAVDQGATRRVTPLNTLSLHDFHSQLLSAWWVREPLIVLNVQRSWWSTIYGVGRCCSSRKEMKLDKKQRLLWVYGANGKAHKGRRSQSLPASSLKLRQLKALPSCESQQKDLHRAVSCDVLCVSVHSPTLSLTLTLTWQLVC